MNINNAACTFSPRPVGPLMLTIGLVAMSAPAQTPEDKAAPGAWRSDIDVLITSIEAIHPDPWWKEPRTAWAEERRLLEESIDGMQPHETILGFYRLMALAADGHTEAANRIHPALRGPWYPMLVRRFDDGWFIRTAHRDLNELFGKRITHMAGMPIEEVVARVRPFISADNEMGALDGIGNHLRMPAVLHAAGVTPQLQETVTVAALNRDGEEVTVVVRANDDVWVTPEWADADSTINQSPKFLYRRADGNYEFHYLEDDEIAYVWFDSVRDDDGETIEQFFGRVFEFVASNPVEKFVLDIRENSGGNLELNPPILHGILCSEINEPGRLFVIIGRDTYSAAMNLAVLLERHTCALFVGEPTGATPNHFGDTVELKLPASGLVVEISELYWQNSDPRDVRPWITPDLPAPLTSKLFFEHRDPALEAIRAFNASAEFIEEFGPPIGRWRRANQLQVESWRGVSRSSNDRDPGGSD